MKYFTIIERTDGFGAQFQTILFTLFYCEKNNYEFIYNQINSIEHNYDKDPEFIHKVDNLMNIKNNYKLYSSFENKFDINIFNVTNIINIIQSDINNYINNNTTKKYKEIFWKNKNRLFDVNKINISVHIRRPNKDDCRTMGSQTPNDYYLEIINEIRNNYNDKKINFHIYSQGNINDFEIFKNDDVIFHINEDLFSTFTGLVSADILITSASSFSYSAALISDGIIYYMPFWHPPLNNWIICKNIKY